MIILAIVIAVLLVALCVFFFLEFRGLNKRQAKLDARPLDDWADDYLKALKVRHDMIVEHGTVDAWLVRREEYERRLAEAAPVPLEHAELLVAKFQLVVKMAKPPEPRNWGGAGHG